MVDTERFVDRFAERAQAERYRDRYHKGGRRARLNALEHRLLESLLEGIGRVEVALDLPCGTGRFSAMLAEHADRMILADASQAMLDLAREDLDQPSFEYKLIDAEHIDLPDKSVDLIFCHRFLHHIRNTTARATILSELVRVSRRYVILPYYPSGLRSHLRWSLKWLTLRVPLSVRPLTLPCFAREIAPAGLCVKEAPVIRRFLLKGMFYLLECD